MRKVHFRIDNVLGFIGFRYDCMVDDSGFYHFDKDIFGRTLRFNVEYGVVHHVSQFNPGESSAETLSRIRNYLTTFYGSSDF